jgi:hypothetical protein
VLVKPVLQGFHHSILLLDPSGDCLWVYLTPIPLRVFPYRTPFAWNGHQHEADF